MKISIQGSIDTPMYMSSTNIIFNCMLGIYVGLALEQYCNLVIGIFIGNFILNMLTTGLLSMGLSASLQDTASGIFLLVIMIFTYNNQRVMNFISERKLKKELVTPGVYASCQLAILRVSLYNRNRQHLTGHNGRKKI